MDNEDKNIRIPFFFLLWDGSLLEINRIPLNRLVDTGSHTSSTHIVQHTKRLAI